MIDPIMDDTGFLPGKDFVRDISECRPPGFRPVLRHFNYPVFNKIREDFQKTDMELTAEYAGLKISIRKYQSKSSQSYDRKGKEEQNQEQICFKDCLITLRPFSQRKRGYHDL